MHDVAYDNICQMIERTPVVRLEEARASARSLAELEGILCGLSSGASLHEAPIAAPELFS